MAQPSVLDSILFSVKKQNNVAADYTAFDNDFIMYINAALADLNQLGIGPAEGFTVRDANDFWDDFVPEEPRLNAIKTFVGLKVRLLFDPPQNSFGISMMQEQIKEHANRLMWAQEDINAEETA